jgi:polyhydroxyalkanoate synthesis regulator phasin
MEEKEAKLQYLDAYRGLLQAMMKLVEVNSKVKPNKLSAEDGRTFVDALRAGEKASKAMGQTIANAPSDADLYAQMTASTERMREEIERQIEIVEELISGQSA